MMQKVGHIGRRKALSDVGEQLVKDYRAVPQRYALGGVQMSPKVKKPVVAGKDRGGPLPRNAPTVSTKTKQGGTPSGGGPMSKTAAKHRVSPYGED